MVIAIKIKNNKKIPLRSISFLQFIIPFISTHFFGQIFYTLLTIFFARKILKDLFLVLLTNVSGENGLIYKLLLLLYLFYSFL
jgi:hypothetical protein